MANKKNDFIALLNLNQVSKICKKINFPTHATYQTCGLDKTLVRMKDGSLVEFAFVNQIMKIDVLNKVKRIFQQNGL